MSLPSVHRLRTVHLTTVTADISTAGSVFIRAPFRAKVVKLTATIANAITVANNTVTCKITGTAITGGVITVVQSGSAAGNTFNAVPTALNHVNEDDVIEFAFTGSTTTCPTTFEAVLEPE